MPGKIPWLNASPTKLMRRITKKLPTTPEETATIKDANKALCIKGNVINGVTKKSKIIKLFFLIQVLNRFQHYHPNTMRLNRLFQNSARLIHLLFYQMQLFHMPSLKCNQSALSPHENHESQQSLFYLALANW